MMHFLDLLLLPLLWQGSHGEEAHPVLHIAGDNVMLTWELPISNATFITIAKDNFTMPVFYGSTSLSGNIIMSDQYKNRTEVLGLYAGKVSFTLKNVTGDDAGHYLCFMGLGEVRLPDCGQMLVIIDRPVEVTVSASDAPVVGRDLMLECQAQSRSKPSDHGLQLQVEWFDMAGQPVASEWDKVEVNGKQLTVRSIARDYEGLLFSCRAADGLNMWSEKSQPYVLQPQFAPTETDVQLIPARSHIEVRNGGFVDQQCSVNCRPNCTLSWQKMQSTGGGFTVVNMGETLILANIQRDGDGTYRCLASNVHGNTSQQLHIVVMYKPSRPWIFINGNEQSSARLTEGQRVNMTCVFDSKPAPQVAWYNQGNGNKALMQRDLASQTPIITQTGHMPHATYISDFVIPEAACSDTNKYICTANNSLGPGIDGQIDLAVACMPRNTHGELRLQQMYTSPVDEPVDIKFQVVAFPDPKIENIVSEDAAGQRTLEEENKKWTQSYTKNTAHPYLTTFTLRFPSPTLYFFDRTYYLRISNDEGSKVLAFKLMAKGPPKPPVNLTAVSVGDRTVVLRFIPGFHGGKPQTFWVEYQLLSDTGGDHKNWTVVPTPLQETQSSQPVEVNVMGLEPSTTYSMHVRAMNQHGANTSNILVVSTLAAAAASASAGTIVGIVIAVVTVLLIAVAVLYIFVIKRRKGSKKEADVQTKQPMLGSEDDRRGSSSSQQVLTVAYKNSSNNSTHTENDSGDKATPGPSDCRQRNKDGLIYADLDLSMPSHLAVVTRSEDTVNYETIDFTQRAPTPPSPSIELPSDEEEVK